MRLSLKKSFNNWVAVKDSEGNEVKFLLDYFTREQEQHLQSLIWQVGQKGADSYLGLQYAQYYIKYCVKDWQGIVDDNDKPVKCVVINDELKDDIWWALVKDPSQALTLQSEFDKELQFTFNDKKK